MPTMPTMPDFDDRQCVAALNSCIDLGKYQDLPDAVRKRLRKLSELNRFKIVCFFEEVGFGLKVYKDPAGTLEDDDGDELLPPNKDTKVKVADAPHWLRCPKELFDAKGGKTWVVMDRFARKYVGPAWKEDFGDPNDYDWKTTRTVALKFTDRDEAVRVAGDCQGVVVENDR